MILLRLRLLHHHFRRCLSWSCRFLECSTLDDGNTRTHRETVHVVSLCCSLLMRQWCQLFPLKHKQSVVVRLTSSGWPPALVRDRHTQTDTDGVFQYSVWNERVWQICTQKQLMGTHWYCKCVVIMDIFLRLWKTDNNDFDFFTNNVNKSKNLTESSQAQVVLFVVLLSSSVMKSCPPVASFTDCLCWYLHPQSAGWRPPESPYFSLLVQEAERNIGSNITFWAAIAMQIQCSSYYTLLLLYIILIWQYFLSCLFSQTNSNLRLWEAHPGNLSLFLLVKCLTDMIIL